MKLKSKKKTETHTHKTNTLRSCNLPLEAFTQPDRPKHFLTIQIQARREVRKETHESLSASSDELDDKSPQLS